MIKIYTTVIIGAVAWCAVPVFSQENPNQLIWEALEYIKEYQIEQKKTQPDDAINTAIESFMEQDYGSNGATEQEELLQLPSSVDRQGS
tara:strand:+ start:946 stop:1212 length:267 start_codon:yes stop_codon:yes gene_type:complete